MSYTEFNRLAQRDLRKAVKNGLEPWAKCHCERVIAHAKVHAERSRDRSVSKDLRKQLYDRALRELLMITDMLGVFSMVKAGSKSPATSIFSR